MHTPATGLRRLIATALFGALVSSFVAVCVADAGSPPISVKVSDLDLSKPAHALVLYDRIRAAAQHACSFYWFKRDADEARCVHDSIAKTVAQVNRPALSAVYNAKYKTSVPSTLVSQRR